MATAIWDKKNPKSKHKQMSSSEKAKAKKAAKRDGRSSPGLVDNINAMKSKKKKKSGEKKSKRSGGKKKG